MRISFTWRKYFNLLAMTACFYTAQAGGELLPTPLSLSKALSYADTDHPDLLLADAELAYAVSRKLEVETSNDIDVYLDRESGDEGK